MELVLNVSFKTLMQARNQQHVLVKEGHNVYDIFHGGHVLLVLPTSSAHAGIN